MAQLVAQLPSQSARKSPLMPTARHVEIPDTIKDISPDRINPKTIGEKRAGITGASNAGCFRSVRWGDTRR